MRRVHRKKRSGRWPRFLVLLGLVVMLLGPDVLLEGVALALTFVEAYPSRFMAFYKPKMAAVASLMQQAVDELEISEQVEDAWDFTVAFVTVVSVYHIVESIRTAAVGRLSASSLSNEAQ